MMTNHTPDARGSVADTDHGAAADMRPMGGDR